MRTDTLTKAAPSRQSGPRMSHGIYSRRFRHGVTWYIRYFVAGQEVKERVGREPTASRSRRRRQRSRAGSDPKSTRRYAHLSQAHTAAAMARLSERLAQPEPPTVTPAVAVAGVARAPATVPNLEQNWNATSGRQTAAKREYLRSQRAESGGGGNRTARSRTRKEKKVASAGP